jgi:hypothetical protein
MRYSHSAPKLVLGSIIVYVAMAACGGGPDPLVSNGKDAGTDGQSLDSTSPVDAMLDALTDPVKEASAAPPDVAVEQCDKISNLTGSQVLYAEHAYPNKTVVQLAGVVGVAHMKSVATQTLPSYSDAVLPVQLRPGFAAVVCGPPGPNGYDTVTFVLPQ